MEKASEQTPAPSLQANGMLSPPPTPAALNSNGTANVNANANPMGILDGNHFHNDRPVSPAPSSNHSSTSSISSSPAQRASSTFTEGTSFTDSQPAAPLKRKDASCPLPTCTVHGVDDDITPSQQPQTQPQSTPRAVRRSHAEGARTKIRTCPDGRDEHTAFPRLSKPVELLRSVYDVVVIGSGYGGGVAASRMARTGESVCLLERGREKWPGEYPVGTAASVKELHCSGVLAPGELRGKSVEEGDPTGMFHLVMGRGQSAVVANGLGGTSLINANVFMPADKKTLGMNAWPPEIRNRADGLDEYYDKVAAVLQPQEYPAEWPELPKATLLKKQADALGLGEKFKKVLQTTRFINGPNSCGVEMSPSALTGQDATGLNDGSKNTTLVTYVADAWNWGAEIFCECEVRYIEKAKEDDGYRVYFAWHGRNRGLFKANLHGDLMWVHAKKAVFLGAGAIASSEILLRSKAMGLEMSDLVGHNMSGNGDMLAFGYNTDDKVNALGCAVPSPYNPIGPTITSVIDCRDGHDNPLDGFVVEEGAVPHALGTLLQAMLDLMPGKQEAANETVVEKTRAAFARYGSRFLGPYFKNGAMERTQVYLVMSHDSNQAVLSLQDDKPVLEFLGVARSHHVKTLNKLLARATEAVGGTLVQSPFFELLGQEITVHPVGGACMARDNTGRTGVTNHVGQLFTGNGIETYDGLIVTDASVIPTALGANPFATIAALAERSVEEYAARKGLTISEERNDVLDLFGEPKHPAKRDRPAYKREQAKAVEEQESVSAADKVIRTAHELRAGGFGFTEVMSGFIHYNRNLTGEDRVHHNRNLTGEDGNRNLTGEDGVHHNRNLTSDDRDTYQLSYRIAESLCESARFFLSVQAFDTTELVNASQHRGMLTGTFVCPAIPGSPFMVQRGEFNLFILNYKAPGTRNLTYDFDMTGVNGRKLHFHGYKVVDSSVALAPFQFWKATSTLYVTVSEHEPGMCADPDDEDAWRLGKVLAKGIMHIRPADFLSQISTMSPTGSNLIRKAVSAASFLTYFTRKSLSLFLSPLTSLQYPTQTFSGFINNTPWTDSVEVTASDKVTTRMHIWEPTHSPGDDPKNERNLFMIPGASVDHQIFALPTIPYNAVNYFRRAGYRVFISVHRISQLMLAGSHWTTYDARLDLRACLEYIRAKHGQEKVYCIAHCMGSVAFSSGLLDGTIPASWIRGITCSQVFMNPVWGPTNMAKVLAGPIPFDKMYSMLAGSWFSCGTSTSDTLVQQAVNQLLRLYPQSRREMCNNAACHRASLVFGRCWNHANLNEATHRQIDRFFGGVNMTMLNLLMRMGADGHVMANAPGHTRLTTPENVERLRGIPILLFVGRDNAVLSPRATEKTYEVLCDTFGDDGDYRRRVVPGYGHLDGWMGRNAWKDVYPFVREEVDRVTRGEDYRFEEPEDGFKKMVDNGVL